MPKAGEESRRDYLKYREYYLRRESSPEGIRKRVKRDQARDAAIKAGLIEPGSHLEVDHKKPLSKGGTNAPSNLQVVTRTANRRKHDD